MHIHASPRSLPIIQHKRAETARASGDQDSRDPRVNKVVSDVSAKIKRDLTGKPNDMSSYGNEVHSALAIPNAVKVALAEAPALRYTYACWIAGGTTVACEAFK
jgi:hypothetical protein